MQKKWWVLSEIWSKLSIKIWVSWQCYVTFQSAWLEGSEPSPKATGRDFLSVIWTIWNLKLKEISAGTSGLNATKAFTSLIPACSRPPSPDAAPGLLCTEGFHILPAWVLPCLKQEAQNAEPEMHAPYLLTSPGSLHLSSSSSSRQNWPPILPTRSPCPVWERRRLDTRTLLKELEEAGGQAPQLECAARGHGREKSQGRCGPLSQTPWGALSSKRPPPAHKAKRHQHWTRGNNLKVTTLRETVA